MLGSVAVVDSFALDSNVVVVVVVVAIEWRPVDLNTDWCPVRSFAVLAED